MLGNPGRAGRHIFGRYPWVVAINKSTPQYSFLYPVKGEPDRLNGFHFSVTDASALYLPELT
jgi:hypothetical protein